MISTNSKLFKQRIQAHILEHFSPENYDSESTDPLANLREQMDAMQYGNKTTDQVALEYMEGGGMLVYFCDARDFLQKTLEQTDEQAAKYDNDTVWVTYCHTMAREMAHLYNEGVK